jgi:hypothetical protein
MDKIKLLGLPGLYQNWIMSAIDSSSEVALSCDNNFITKSTEVTWIKKIDHDLIVALPGPVINCWVHNENFVWYLYNFLEKTDGVGIQVESLVDDLFNKAAGTIAFDTLLKHFVDAYDITQMTEREYACNATIEYFYFLLCDQKGKFKTQTQYTHNNFINLEYNEFGDKKILIDKLSTLPNFDLDHFENQYHQLIVRNVRYINKRRTFIEKFLNHSTDFDILELSYIGYLVGKITGTPVDWFNPDVRENNMLIHKNKICKLLDSML